VTADEAKEVLRVGLNGAAKQDLDEARVELMALHLAPLPFERTRRHVHEYVLGHKWLSSLEELLDAAGVAASARADLARAIHEGGQLLPSLRSMSGWEYVPRGGPYPEGVALFYREARQPLPKGARVAPLALPAAAVQPAAASGPAPVLQEIGTELQRRKNAALRRSFEALRSPPAPFVPDREAMPPVLRQAVDAAEAQLDRATRAEQRCIAQERCYRELCEEMTGMLRARAPDGLAARGVVVDLLRVVLADPCYGLIGCVEALRDAVCPGAEVAMRPEHGPNPDEFDDAPGPLVALRVGLRKAV